MIYTKLVFGALPEKCSGYSTKTRRRSVKIAMSLVWPLWQWAVGLLGNIITARHGKFTWIGDLISWGMGILIGFLIIGNLHREVILVLFVADYVLGFVCSLVQSYKMTIPMQYVINFLNMAFFVLGIFLLRTN